MFISKRKNAKARRGFNLIEAAIVLGVVGLIIGGIWVAAAAVQSNMKKSDASRGLIQIVQNVRNLYYGQSPTATADITTQLINAGALPANFVNGTAGINPWNGAVTVAIAGASFDQVDVTFNGLPRDGCIELTSRNTNISTGVGLTQMIVDATTGGTDITVSGVGTDTTNFPFLPTQAAINCGTANNITWRFGLRG